MTKSEIDVIHDFEIQMPSRRPKILMQTVAHVSGAAYYYKEKSDRSETNTEPKRRQMGVCIHPKYGGWFGLRGVFILREIQRSELMPKQSLDVVPDNQDQQRLLKLFNEQWYSGLYRDIIPVKERYSDLQLEYFTLKPKDRIEFLLKRISPIIERNDQV